MSRASAEHVRDTIAALCAPELAAVGIDPALLADDFDLRAGGVIDSLGFLELVTALEDELGIELDFDEMDPSCLTVVGALAAHVAAQADAVAGVAEPRARLAS